MFEKKANSEYNHMSIAFDKTNSYCYVESFFHEKTDKYIKGQTVVKIKKITLYDKQDNVLVTDMF